MKSISPACAWMRSSTARLSRQGNQPKHPLPRRVSASIVKPICLLICAGATSIAETIGRPVMSHDLGEARRSCHRVRRIHHRQIHRGRRPGLCFMAQHRPSKPAPIQRRSPRSRPPTPQFPAPLRQGKVMKTKQKTSATGPSQPLPSRVIRTPKFLVCVGFLDRQLEKK